MFGKFNRNQGNKTSFAIALTLLLALSTMIAIVPAVTAHTPSINVPTYAFVNCNPNPTGVGQTITINMWLDKVPPTANVQFGDRWQNFTITITKPDGTTQTLGPYHSDDIGASYTTWTPTAVGTYTLVFNFPGQIIAGANPPINNAATVGDYYLPSTSAPLKLVVQSQSIPAWPLTPLPSASNNYWQRPVYAMNSNWQPIVGDWLMSGYDYTGNFADPYTLAPTSAHIAWAYPMAYGGVAGGNHADWNYYTGLAYETKFGTGVIMDGNLIFTIPMNDVPGLGGTVSLNLRTGQQNWIDSNMTSISFGQDIDYSSPNQYGVTSYLWASALGMMNAYDPFSGQWCYSIANLTSGTTTMDDNGNIITYTLSVNAAHAWLACWNSTQDIMHYMDPTVTPMGNAWEWRPRTTTVMDWKYGLMWNVTVTPYTQTVPGSAALSYQSIKRIASGVIYASTIGSWSIPNDYMIDIGYSMTTGQQLWEANRTGPIDWNTLQGSPAGNGVYTMFHPETMTWDGYSLTTGNHLWGPTTPYPQAFGVYSWQARIADGLLIAADYGGYVHAFNLTTGSSVWNFYGGDSGVETVYGAWPFNSPMGVADGMVFATVGHAYNPPLFKGAQVFAINETTGKKVWSELGFYVYNGMAIADGDLILYNNYDGQLYCYGATQSGTTVGVQNNVVSLGSTSLIAGTVTDQGPGKTGIGVPAAGTPAISDASMSDWMAYLYMQQPKPTNATGVTVHLTAFDPNNNTEDLGYATSDASGTFALPFVAPVTGLYRITASFAGTNSYFASSAETTLYVTAAPAAVPAATAAPTAVPTQAPTTNAPTVAPTATVAATPSPVVIPPTSAAPTATYLAIGAVIIIALAAAAALIIRRRK